MSRSKLRVLSEINVVPYIDVTLVLLVIFMITAPLLTQGVAVNLRTSRSTSRPFSNARLPSCAATRIRPSSSAATTPRFTAGS